MTINNIINKCIKNKRNTLNLSSNKLTSIPKEIGKLTQLKYLDLSFNKLTSIPHEIGNLTQLKYLDLTDNQLCWIPISIGKLCQCTDFYINLVHNPLNINLQTMYNEIDYNYSKIILKYFHFSKN
jgi:Leucine-rich repeat (LRR) protein